MMEPFSKARLVTGASERRSIERTSDSTPLRNKFIQRNLEMFLIWSFVVFCFAVFFFFLWVISAKCRGDRPYSTSRGDGTTTTTTHQIERSK